MPHLRENMDEWSRILEAFALFQRGANLSEKTIQNRQECLLKVATMSQKSARKITEEDLLRVLGRPHPRREGGLAAGTKQSERSYMQTFFKWMKRTKRRKTNPAKYLPKVKVPRRTPRPLTEIQIDAMLNSGSYRRTRDIILIAALTGLRLGEVVAIRGEDLDLVGLTIRSLRKGNLDHRIGLHPAIAELAQRYPAYGWWFPSSRPNRQFPNGDGHILMKSASDRVSKAIRNAGITDQRITGHSLRHFLATTLVHEEVQIRVIQEILGHASLATTQIYTGITEEQMLDGIMRVEPPHMPLHSGRKSHAESVRIAA